MPGIGLEIDGAMQQAPHPSRQACGGKTSAGAGRTAVSAGTRLSGKQQKIGAATGRVVRSCSPHCATAAATLLHNAAQSRIYILESI
jgi:hypothetical protein